MKELFLLLALTFNPSGQYYSENAYKDLWAKVDAALDEGKPQTAATYLNQLEKLATNNLDTLERYEVMLRTYECLAQYNWKSANKYYPGFRALQNQLFNNLDHYIEQYPEHPRTGALVVEKIRRIKNTEDASQNPSGARYTEIRRMCTLAAKHYPKYAASFMEIVNEMDSKSLAIAIKSDDRYSTFIYPGDEIRFDLSARNISASDFIIYRLNDRYDTVGEITVDNIKPYAKQFSRQSITTYGDEYNILETVTAEYTFSKPGIYVVFNIGEGESSYMVLNVSSVALATREIGGAHQVYAADARSGKPFSNATVYASSPDDLIDTKAPLVKRKYLSQMVYTLDGFTTLSQNLFEKDSRTSQIFAEYASDMWSPAVGIYSSVTTRKAARQEEVHYIYTDRKLYRAGDTIHFKLIALSTNYEKGKVLARKKIAVSIYAPGGNKPLSATNVTTNSMGSAAGAFVIPAGTKNGMYRIATDLGSTVVNVEAYKDPKYKLEFEKIEGVYTFGDRLVQRGRLIGYTGEPVPGARIEYTVETYLRRGRETVAEGETRTDADGFFEVPFTAPRPDDKNTHTLVCSVEVKSVAKNGETCEKRKGVMVSQSSIVFNAQFDNQYHLDTLLLVNKDKASSVTVTASNYDDVAQKTGGEYRLLKGEEVICEGDISFGEPLAIDFARLASGEYSLEYKTMAGGVSQSGITRFALFSPDDGKCPAASDMFFYPVEDKGVIDFVVGSSSELYAELELFDDGKVVYRRAMHLKGRAEHIKLDYKAAYSDRVTVSLFAFKDMEQISKRHDFCREVPSGNFEIKVTGLRDKTTPNTTETFTIEAPASEMLVSIYDVTCDRYRKNTFGFNPIHQHYSPVPFIHSNINGGYGPVFYSIHGLKEERRMFKSAARANGAIMMDVADSAVGIDAEEAASFATADMADDFGDLPDPLDVREDFSQTLAFIPQLAVPSSGKANVTFTTRDGLSTFRIAMLAHTKDLRSGTAERFFIVNKAVKIETNTPLFAVEGDDLVINATVTNTSHEKVSGIARLSLTDEQTQEKLDVEEAESSVTLDSGETKMVFWRVRIPKDVRKLGVVASFAAKNSNDAEKHQIEILPASRTITEAESFIVGGGRNKESCIRDLKARFPYPGATVRYEEYSTKEALLEVLRKPEYPKGDNMIEWLDALYVNQMRGCLLGPDSIDVALSRRAVAKLSQMQHADGGFGWFPGNGSSDLLTLMFLDKTYYMREVGKLPRNTDINKQIEKALGYVDKRILEITSAKKWDWRDLTYFYSARMEHPNFAMSEQIQKILKEYLRRSKDGWQKLPVVEKAKLCTVLEATGENRHLFTVLRSLRDYAVKNGSVGCYFPNAAMPYRGMLHTEIYAHATLAVVFAEMDQMDVARGIMKWLLLQKHNQQWESNMASADAIFALIKYKAPEMTFGAVYYTYDAPMLSVTPSASQISVERSWWRKGRQLKDGDELTVGDKIEVRYKINNTENRSFVVMEADRPACFYPVDERSYGSHWFYCERRGECTKYYFQVLAEEDTNLSESFYVTQEGTFNSGLVQIESLYAPEYRGHTGAFKVTSEAE